MYLGIFKTPSKRATGISALVQRVVMKALMSTTGHQGKTNIYVLTCKLLPSSAESLKLYILAIIKLTVVILIRF